MSRTEPDDQEAFEAEKQARDFWSLRDRWTDETRKRAVGMWLPHLLRCISVLRTTNNNLHRDMQAREGQLLRQRNFAMERREESSRMLDRCIQQTEILEAQVAEMTAWIWAVIALFVFVNLLWVVGVMVL